MKNVLILCGGRSTEHEISLLSARHIVSSLEREVYMPVVVVIGREGVWYWIPTHHLLEKDAMRDDLTEGGVVCTLMRQTNETLLMTLSGDLIPIASVFPIIHGNQGEDGSLQGLLEMMQVPYVGSEVLSSAVGIDKQVMKQHFAIHNLPVGRWQGLEADLPWPSYRAMCAQLQSEILFVKPVRAGSSVGISRVTQEKEWLPALQEAVRFDERLIVEQAIGGRELECAVLGNKTPIASCVGEIKPRHAFYSYEAKYCDPEGAELCIPAALSAPLSEAVQTLAIRAFQALRCVGMARVDFFLTSEGTLLLNELNTLPGFTPISMYPHLWEASGLSAPELVHRLLLLAEEAFVKKQQYTQRFLPGTFLQARAS